MSTSVLAPAPAPTAPPGGVLKRPRPSFDGGDGDGDAVAGTPPDAAAASTAAGQRAASRVRKSVSFNSLQSIVAVPSVSDMTLLEREENWYAHKDFGKFAHTELARRRELGITSTTAMCPEAEKAAEADEYGQYDDFEGGGGGDQPPLPPPAPVAVAAAPTAAPTAAGEGVGVAVPPPPAAAPRDGDDAPMTDAMATPPLPPLAEDATAFGAGGPPAAEREDALTPAVPAAAADDDLVLQDEPGTPPGTPTTSVAGESFKREPATAAAPANGSQSVGIRGAITSFFLILCPSDDRATHGRMPRPDPIAA